MCSLVAGVHSAPQVVFALSGDCGAFEHETWLEDVSQQSWAFDVSTHPLFVGHCDVTSWLTLPKTDSG